MELEDIVDLKSTAKKRTGSSPVGGTTRSNYPTLTW